MNEKHNFQLILLLNIKKDENLFGNQATTTKTLYDDQSDHSVKVPKIQQSISQDTIQIKKIEEVNKPSEEKSETQIDKNLQVNNLS